MDMSFLPLKIKNCIDKLDFNYLYEIRLREGFEVLLFYKGKYTTISDLFSESLVCRREDIDFVIERITQKSVYAFNDQIKKGFLTLDSGIRIGLCGRVIEKNGQVQTISQFSSLNIRIPHKNRGCSDELYNKLFIDELKSVLIFSKPFMGKTTILKDLTLNINDRFNNQILIIDERCEFVEVCGQYIDKITNCNKSYCFEYALRSMAPEIVVCDEIAGESDWQYLKTAEKTGVKIIASAHFDCIDNLKNCLYFKKGIFDYYVQLKNSDIKGFYERIYDKDFNLICSRSF